MMRKFIILSLLIISCSAIAQTFQPIENRCPDFSATYNSSSCDPADAGTWVDSLMTWQGCDSVITFVTTLVPAYTITISNTTCDPAVVGTTIDTFLSAQGCDSIVFTTTYLTPSDSVLINTTSCDPAQIGVTTNLFTNSLGCDSVVIISTALLSGGQCDSATMVTGRAFWDKDEDNIFNNDDVPFQGISVEMSPDNLTFYTNNEGLYTIFTDVAGNHSLTVNAPRLYDCDGEIVLNQVTPMGAFDFEFMTAQEIEQDFIFNGDEIECRSLSGNVFNDENSNGIKDASENGLGGIRVILNDSISTYTASNGNYSFIQRVDEILSIEILLVSSSSNGYCTQTVTTYEQTFPANMEGYTVSAGTNDTAFLDFGVNLEVESSFDAGLYSLYVYQGNQAGEPFHAYMDFKANGITSESCTLRIDHSPLLTLLNSDIPATNTGNNFVEWIFPNGSAPSFWCMQMDWMLDESAVMGDILHWEAHYDCSPGTDACPANNQIIRDIPIISGPVRIEDEANQLRSMAPEGIMPEVITNDATLSYVISFQNNSVDQAYNIMIIDTLPEELDYSSISWPFSSFPDYEMTITTDGILVFQLKGINLPNIEEDELNSYGFVQFNIKLKNNLPAGTIISNKASILFNGVEEVNTNTIIHRLENSTAIFNEEFLTGVSIFPNPFSSYTILKFENSLDFNYDVRMVDILGKTVSTYLDQSDSELLIKSNDLPHGLYFLNLYKAQSQEILGSYKVIIR